MVESVRVVADVTYISEDGAALKGDFYLPSSAGPHPTVVSMHGGGWHHQFRKEYAHWGRFLAERGYALFAVDRREFKRDEIVYPKAVNDLQKAVTFAKSKAQELHLDPDRFALMGDSSGAYLAAIAGMLAEDHSSQPAKAAIEHPARVKCVIAIYGAYDLTAEWAFEQIVRPFDRTIESLFGVPLVDDRKAYFDASPLAYAIRRNNRLAFFLGWGSDDDVVSEKLHSEPFARALAQAEFVVSTNIIPQAQHYWFTEPLDQTGSRSALLAPRLMRFLTRHL